VFNEIRTLSPVYVSGVTAPSVRPENGNFFFNRPIFVPAYPYRVKVDISAQLQKVIVAFDYCCAISTLKHMSAGVMLDVVVYAVTREHALHESADIGPGCLHHKVKVIIHQAKQIDSNFIEITAFRQPPQQPFSVGIVMKYDSLAVTSDRNVVDRALIL
jgi:hypothetical protein